VDWPDLVKHPQLSFDGFNPHLGLFDAFHGTHQAVGPELLSDKVPRITTTLFALQRGNQSGEVSTVLFALDTLGHESRASGDIVSRLVILDGSGESGISGGQHLEDERGTWEGGRLELGLGLGISEEEGISDATSNEGLNRNKGTYSSAEQTWRLNLVSPEPSLGEKYACTEVATQAQLC
jgi:hypothetical protein